ncbi:MAG: nucleotidyltransferase domain-containing protein [bacterium]
MKDFPSLFQSIKEALVHEDDVLFAYLFGSAARGDTTPQSDIDIAVYLRPSTTEQYLKREADLTGTLISALRTAEIDLRILNALPLVFQHEILKGGTLLFCRDDLERVDFETRVMLRYFQLKPYIEEYRSLLIQRIRGE